jgi:L-iditol 2-dehydrogenase
MKAALLTAPGQLELREVPAPVLERDDDVLLRTKLVGICGSDLHYFSSARVGDLEIRYPVRLGHECAAVVEDAGPAVTRLKRGDAVSVEPAVSCGTCDQCLAGRPHTCRRLRFMGSPGQSDGALAEFLVMPERNCHPLPPGMTPALGVIAEPLSIGLWAVTLAGRVEVRSVGILGAGPIGLSVLLGTRVKGARSVYVTEKVKARLEAAKRAGADWTGNPERADVAAEILRLEPLGLDVVFECCGKQEALDQAVRILKPGGTLVVVGIPVEERMSFDSAKLRRKEIRVQSVRRQNGCLEKALGLLAGGTVDAGFMATHAFPLDRVRQAYDTALNYRDGVIKAMVSLS